MTHNDNKKKKTTSRTKVEKGILIDSKLVKSGRGSTKSKVQSTSKKKKK